MHANDLHKEFCVIFPNQDNEHAASLTIYLIKEYGKEFA